MASEKSRWARISHLSGYVSLIVSFATMVGAFWLQLESHLRKQRDLQLAEQTAGRETANSERDRLADKRELLADERQKRADVREQQADERGKLADARDRDADERDRRAFNIALVAVEREQKAFEIQQYTFEMEKRKLDQEQADADRDRKISFVIDRESIEKLKAPFKDRKQVKLNLTNASKGTLPLHVNIVTSGCWAHPNAHAAGGVSYSGITQSMALAGYTVKVDDTTNYSFFIHTGESSHPDSVITIEVNGMTYAQFRFVWAKLAGEYIYKG